MNFIIMRMTNQKILQASQPSNISVKQWTKESEKKLLQLYEKYVNTKKFIS